MKVVISHSVLKFIIFLLSVVVMLLASMFGAYANEIHKNGFGGITPLNTTGLTVFSDVLKRSFEYESDSLVLSAEFSILETNGDIRDFSLFDNDLVLTSSDNSSYVDSTFRTSLYMNGTLGDYAYAPHSSNLNMENTNISMIWWGQLREIDYTQYVMGKIGTSPPSPSCFYDYGFRVTSSNYVSAVVTSQLPCVTDFITSEFVLDMNLTYGVGIRFEDNTSGSIVDFWVNGDWVYQEQSTERIEDSGLEFRVGARNTITSSWCNCTHDEVLIFKERLDNSTMKLLTTRQHDIVIKSGPLTTPQGFGGLFFALPWVIVFGLLAWVGYALFVSLKGIFK